ncbi:MAG: putative holin [Mycobacteriaceae bacterium]|nr:putative holin [Mycobacteriaceae bacterium]
MIPLPRPRLLTSALLIGTAFGLLLGIGASLVVTAKIRPDVVIALVVGVPGVIGMLTILLSRRRWLTAVGAFVIAISPGWFGALVAIQTVNGA